MGRPVMRTLAAKAKEAEAVVELYEASAATLRSLNGASVQERRAHLHREEERLQRVIARARERGEDTTELEVSTAGACSLPHVPCTAAASVIIHLRHLRSLCVRARACRSRPEDDHTRAAADLFYW